MLLTLETTNFRKLTKGRFNFTEGLNAIRGLNEAGKTTMLEAFAYLISGVQALREPLADVVTWGEKESSLKVAGTFTINDTLFSAKRGKSGAEISSEGKVLATGQTEVTRFIFGMLGADPKVAANLMLADQGSLRGALKEGPTATSALIEKLSNFSLIDEIIALVQEKLNTGNTSVLEDRVKQLSIQATSEAPDLLDQTAELAQQAKLKIDLDKQQSELADAKTELAPAAAAAAAARQLAARLSEARTSVTHQANAADRATASLAALRPVSTVSPEQLQALRAAAGAEQTRAQALTAKRAVTSWRRPDTEWEGDRASFDAELAMTTDNVAGFQKDLHARQLARQAALAQRISEQTCAFCSKDLTDVPEVVRRNAEADRTVRELDAAIAIVQGHLADSKETAAALEAISQADRALSQALRIAGPFYKVLDTNVPPTLEWVGPDLDAPFDMMAAQKLQAAEAEVRRADRDAGQQTALQAELDRAQAARAAAEALVKELGPKVAGDRSGGLETDLQAKVNYHTAQVADLQSKLRELAQAMANEVRVHGLQVAAHDRVKQSLAESSLELEDMNRNNLLLRKLRGARPRVADKLWHAVLTTVSHYFSGIRGTQSVVTRDETGFRVDGKPVPGLSGSTLDALGLAIRIGLTKTFLPNNDFMVLDEPAAACDEGRESNMLGVITTAEFKQVLLVTHSELADAYANQVLSV